MADRVAVLVFSEFGRRVAENTSLGTDHGTANTWFFAGKGVRGGHYGQPVKRFADLKRFYEDNLAQLRQGGEASWQTVAIRQVPAPVVSAPPELAEQPEATTTNTAESSTGRLDPSGRF